MKDPPRPAREADKVHLFVLRADAHRVEQKENSPTLLAADAAVPGSDEGCHFFFELPTREILTSL